MVAAAANVKVFSLLKFIIAHGIVSFGVHNMQHIECLFADRNLDLVNSFYCNKVCIFFFNFVLFFSYQMYLVVRKVTENVLYISSVSSTFL